MTRRLSLIQAAFAADGGHALESAAAEATRNARTAPVWIDTTGKNIRKILGDYSRVTHNIVGQQLSTMHRISEHDMVAPSLAGEDPLVLTKSELIASLQHEVHIFLHLAGKIDRSQLDYRPTPKQRSTIELLQYLTVMGPGLIRAATAGTFDPIAWAGAEESAKTLSFDQTLSAIATQTDTYATLLSDLSDADFRATITMFGRETTRGAFIVNFVLSGCAAYRTQLFLYLKGCGREELSTMNLWAGTDAPAPPVSS